MSLKDRLIRQIRMDGPIPISTFMQICLHDPKDGYYACLLYTSDAADE